MAPVKKLDLSTVVLTDKSGEPLSGLDQALASQKRVPLKKSLAKVSELLDKQKQTDKKVERLRLKK